MAAATAACAVTAATPCDRLAAWTLLGDVCNDPEDGRRTRVDGKVGTTLSNRSSGQAMRKASAGDLGRARRPKIVGRRHTENGSILENGDNDTDGLTLPDLDLDGSEPTHVHMALPACPLWSRTMRASPRRYLRPRLP